MKTPIELFKTAEIERADYIAASISYVEKEIKEAMMAGRFAVHLPLNEPFASPIRPVKDDLVLELKKAKWKACSCSTSALTVRWTNKDIKSKRL